MTLINFEIFLLPPVKNRERDTSPLPKSLGLKKMEMELVARRSKIICPIHTSGGRTGREPAENGDGCPVAGAADWLKETMLWVYFRCPVYHFLNAAK